MGLGSGEVGGGRGVRGQGLGVREPGEDRKCSAAFCDLFIYFSFERVKGRDTYLKPSVWPASLGRGREVETQVGAWDG